MKCDFHWQQRAATVNKGSMAAVREPLSPGSKVGYAAAALKEHGIGGIVPASAVALGVADLAMNVSLHCARTGSTPDCPFSCAAAAGFAQPNRGSTHEGPAAAAAGSGGDGSFVGSRRAAVPSSRLDRAVVDALQPAAGSGSSSRLATEPREVVEACRARRVNPRDLVLSPVSYELSELESATLALSCAVASLSSSGGSTSCWEQRPKQLQQPPIPAAGRELSLVTVEDVWLPDEQPRAADDGSAAAGEPGRGDASNEHALGDHPMCASLSVYCSGGDVSARESVALGGTGVAARLPSSARDSAGDPSCSNFSAHFSAVSGCQPSLPPASPSVLRMPTPNRSSPSIGDEAPAFIASGAGRTGSGTQGRPTSFPSPREAPQQQQQQKRADRRSASSAVHGSLPRGSMPPAASPDTAPAGAGCQRHTLDYSALPRVAGSELGTSRPAVVAAKKQQQRRSFSGFGGGGLVGLLERVGLRSLSSSDRLRRRESLDGTSLSLRAAAMAALVNDNEACARRLSVNGCCAAGRVMSGGTSASRSSSSPELSFRVRVPCSAVSCAGHSACSAESAMRNGCQAGELAEADQEDCDSATAATATAATVTRDGCSQSDVDAGSAGSPTSSAIWQMASDRCDILLSLLEEKESSAGAAAAAAPTVCSPRHGRLAVSAQQQPPLAMSAPANSHLRTLAEVPSLPRHPAASATAAADRLDTPTEARRRRPAPSVASADTRKPLSSTPGRASLIMNELVQTEADYVAALRLIVEHYLPVCEFAAPLEPLHGQAAAIFGNVEQLYDFHSELFFAELCRWQHDPFSVGRSFLEHKTNFEAYAFYIKNKPRSDSIMSQHGTQLFKARQQQLADLLDLGSYLLKPIQRLGKYALILQQLVKECSARVEAALSPDGVRLRDQLQQAEDMVRFCLRHGDDLLALDSLYECSIDLTLQGQLLRQEQMAVTRDKKKTQEQVFLFEKVIIFSKIKHVEKGHDLYKYKESISMHNVGLTETVHGLGVGGSLVFELWYQQSGGRGGSLSWLIDAPTLQSKSAWVKDVGRLLWAQARMSKQKLLAGLPHSSQAIAVALLSKKRPPQNLGAQGTDAQAPGLRGHVAALAPRLAETDGMGRP